MDNATDILNKRPDNIMWVLYDVKHAANYKEMHHDKTRGVSTFQVRTAEKTYTREKKIRYNDDMIQTLIIATKENSQIQAKLAIKEHQILSGLESYINPDRPPKNFADVMTVSLGKSSSYVHNLSTRIRGISGPLVATISTQDRSESSWHSYKNGI